MKKLFYLLLLVMPFLYTSCEKEDDPGNGTTQNSAIVGTWTSTYYDYDEEENCTVEITFKKDGTFAMNYKWEDGYKGSTKGKYSYDKEIELLSITVTWDSYDGNYESSDIETEYYNCTVVGKTMTWRVKDDGENYAITFKKK